MINQIKEILVTREELKNNAKEFGRCRYFFSEREEKILKSFGNTDEYCVQSTILWTRKEALSKLFRLGMRMDFKKLDTLEDEVVFQETNRARLFSFICNNYCISLALPGFNKD